MGVRSMVALGLAMIERALKGTDTQVFVVQRSTGVIIYEQAIQ